ncbi:hypothetical protein E2C01_089037 [Portunus trituberculatus]|uniref:Uncharacterized protein n=1 Tax=Portunus trituberculatus TaxID=210409 RepID=A0A5B7JCG2_PORTR|nr:hypothetical protein [Portunus trituberculatus]
MQNVPLAGKDHRRLQGLIPLLLQHNGLPAVHIPLRALTANTSANTRLSRRGHPGNTGKTEVETVAAPNHQQEEAAPAGDEPKNREETETETQDDVAGGEEEEEETEDEDDEDDDEEDEEVDVLGSGSEGEAPSAQPRKPNPPSDPQPPSGKQEDNDGWVTKNKRRRRKPFLRLVLPKRDQMTTPDIALRESPTITRLRREKQTGKVREDVLHGCYIHEENRFVGNIKGYTGFPGYESYPYPQDVSTPAK